MSEISKEQIEALKKVKPNAVGNALLWPEEFATLTALIALAERIASGEAVVVPVEMTADILNAAISAHDDCLDLKSLQMNSETQIEDWDYIYRAMLEASKAKP